MIFQDRFFPEKKLKPFSVFLFFVLFFSSGASFGATNIPSQAWSRDINAGGYVDGAPIGGFGAGTISWDFTGDFYQNRLNIGVSVFSVDANCHFYMYQKPAGQAAAVEMLNAATLGSGQATYHALFPKAWVTYTGSDFPLPVTVTQFSPITPNEYQFSSYPEGIYEWDVTNSTATSTDVAVMLTWDNSFGGTNAAVTTSGNNLGLVLTRNTGNAANSAQGEFTLASQSGAGVTVTYESAASDAALQTAFNTAGLLSNTVGNNALGAIAFKVTLAPGQSVKIPIALAWDIPMAKPGTGASWYREYTKYYGRTGLNSGKIAFDGLSNYASWESTLDSWQSGILGGSYPDWLKQMLFNELYYYVTGGTLWEAGQVGSTAYDSGPNLFTSLESYIYDFYGTSDVRFYGSWPLALLWPDIDKQEVKQFCDSVVTGTSGVPMPAAIGTCAHDVGDENSVFTQWNAYTYRDSTKWKDLNSKLVLMVYRAWELTGKSDTAFLNYCWPAVQTSMTFVHGQCDATGLPISSGEDQTYDDLGLTGDTAYCGSLFLAACEAAQAMATTEGNSALAATYQGWLTSGQASFESLLWDNTGGYYHIDTGSTIPSRIMSDQLAGEWYAKACGLPGIVSDAHANSAWTKVHDNNWAKFDAGAHGVINVMAAAGTIINDAANPQGQEAWVGVGWSVASGLILQGLTSQGTDIGNSLYNSIWNLGQDWFRTPEAWQTGLTNVRAPYYMRANAIWSVKHAYDVASASSCGANTCTPTATPTRTSTATITATPTLTFTPTAMPTLSACASALFRVNAGGGAYTGSVAWSADQAYTTGSWGYVNGTAATITAAITAVSDPNLYQTERYGTPLEYKFTVPNGTYQVALHFVEQYWTGTGDRVFSVAINGTTVLANLDIYSHVKQDTAYIQTFLVPVTGGLIDIVETASVDNAEVAGIEILNNASACSPIPTQTFTQTATLTRTKTSTVTNTPTASFTLTPTWTTSVTGTPSLTSTGTASASWTRTLTATPTPTATASPTSTPSRTASATPSSSSTGTSVATSTGTSTPTLTLSPTGTASSTASRTSTASATSTGTQTFTATFTLSPSQTATPSSTSSATSSRTSTPSITATPTPTLSATGTASFTPSISATGTSTATSTSTRTFTGTPSFTATASATQSSTGTFTATPTATMTKTSSFTDTPTGTPSLTRTFTVVPTATGAAGMGIIGNPYPNPSGGSQPTVVDILGGGNVTVEWEVFTTAFRKIDSGSETLSGNGTLQWDLRDSTGAPVANGLYYLEVEVTGNFGTVRKVLKILVMS